MVPDTQLPLTAPYRGFVLLAEDNLEMRRMVDAELTRAGFVVLAVKDGNELLLYLAWASEYNNRVPLPDLVVTDVRMPGPSGLDVLAALQAVDRRLPTIIMTAFGDDETHARAQALGPVAVFDKPFDLGDLRDAALRAVAQARAPEPP
jgi:CheY-like chemotaxis protein